MSLTAIIDYGVGNLFSLCSSLQSIGAEAVVTPDADVIRRADRIILPGVGAFADAAAKLRATGLDQVLIQEAAKGKPIMGICLGMQMLFDMSYEYGEHRGLGLIPDSGLALKEVFADYDAAKRFGLAAVTEDAPSPCRCGDVICGLIEPTQCLLFGTVCTPDAPTGPCMVSGEGACAAAFQYGGTL